MARNYYLSRASDFVSLRIVNLPPEEYTAIKKEIEEATGASVSMVDLVLRIETTEHETTIAKVREIMDRRVIIEMVDSRQ